MATMQKRLTIGTCFSVATYSKALYFCAGIILLYINRKRRLGNRFGVISGEESPGTAGQDTIC